MINETSSIVFTGDIGFDKYMLNRWEDPELVSEAILDFFHSADHVVANVEGSVDVTMVTVVGVSVEVVVISVVVESVVVMDAVEVVGPVELVVVAIMVNSMGAV